MSDDRVTGPGMAFLDELMQEPPPKPFIFRNYYKMIPPLSEPEAKLLEQSKYSRRTQPRKRTTAATHELVAKNRKKAKAARKARKKSR